MLDFERRLTTKLFDVNRTVSALTSEKRRLVVVENVPEIVFRRCLDGVMCGRAAAPTTVSELLSIVPAHSLVRRHHAGDFCLIAPLFKCTHHFSNSSLTSSSLAPHTPGFFAEPQELFVPLKPAAFSERVVEVISPFPGEMPDDPCCIDPEKYPIINLSHHLPLFFPPLTDSDQHPAIELLGVKKGDRGCFTQSCLSPGSVLLVRDHTYVVTHVTGGGQPYEVYQGADMIVLNNPFPFNARKVIARLCQPIHVKAKHGYLPRSALEPFEPVRMKFSSTKAAQRLGMGSFSVEFSNLSFNKELICHRDSVLHSGQ